MEVLTLEGPGTVYGVGLGKVYAVSCFTLPDGSVRAISGSVDKTLRVWDPIAGTCLATLEGHTDCVLAVACFTLPDGSVRAISAFADKLRVWVVPAEKAAARLLRLPSPAEGG